MTDSPLYVCGYCKQALVLVDINDDLSERWKHVDPSDHGPVPVPADDQAACDFCALSLGGVRRRFNVAPFTIITNGGVCQYDGDWDACKACSDAVESLEWTKLVRRQLATLTAMRGSEATPPESVQAAIAIANGFRSNWDGQPPEVSSTLESQ